MKPTWIVTVGKAEACIYELRHGRASLEQVLKIDNPAGLLMEQELISDRPGRSSHFRNNQRSPLPRKHSAAETVQTRFAALVADQLAGLERKGRFEDLVIAAEPRTLGTLRKALKAHKNLRVVSEMRKDFTNAPKRTVRRLSQSVPRRAVGSTRGS